MSLKSSVVLNSLTFAWPDGSTVLSGINGVIDSGRTGVVGRNGTGKSTLLKLIAGVLSPTDGEVTAAGNVGYLPQNLTLHEHATVADLLGIAQTLSALRAIEAGDADARNFDVVGDDWDIEARAEEVLDEIGFAAADLNRPVGRLSGGEAMLIAILGLRLARNEITLLDEPTNNLDRDMRAMLSGLIDSWAGTLVVVSHDAGLLEQMDHTAELHAGELRTFGGPYGEWKAQLEREQQAALQAHRTAEQALKAEKKQRIEAETKLARRARTARTAQRDGGLPRILAGSLASKAQVSAGAMRSTFDGKVRAAEESREAAEARIREDEHIRLELPDPAVPRGRKIAELRTGEHAYIIQGPERMALVGPNGSGKTTLLRQLLGQVPERGGNSAAKPHTDRIGYLPQRLDGLDEALSALENVRAAAPETPPGAIRNRLAGLLLRGESVDRPVSTLSGGERFRVCLAQLLFAEPPAQLLVLDEPTNNLDTTSVDQLTDALNVYRGALVVVSHDFAFLRRLRLDAILELDRAGNLHPRAALE